MQLEFTHPVMLFALVLFAGIVWAYRKSLLDFSKTQRVFSLAVRLIIVLLLILALAGLSLLQVGHEKMVVFLVDESLSIDENAKKIEQDFLDQVATDPSRQWSVVRFAADILDDFDSQNQTQKRDFLSGTNIAAALEPAIARIPPHFVPNIVLLSDGNETRGDVLTAAIRSGVPVSTVPLPTPQSPEVQLAELRLPSNLRQGEPFNLEVVVQSNTKTDGKITVFRGPYKVLEETKPLEIGENVFKFKQSAENVRQLEFTATVESINDTIIDNNTASGLVFIGGQPRVLLIESDPRVARDFVSALKQQEIDVEVRPSEGVPRTLEELENFETVILSNIPATDLSMRQMDLIRTYVRDLGGGFIMLGGEQSFGLGGYYKTPIEEILPIRSDFEKEKETPSLAICLVIDRSGSMGGEKMELAKDAAKSAVELLTQRDFVSVIAFDSNSYIVSQMQSASSAMSINSAISTIEAGGGTNIYPGLVDAYEQLASASAKLKHVILLTDGYSEPGDYEGITRQMVNAQITVSTVGVGDADNNLLQNIAEIGHGRHYTCDDPQAVPQIFAKETVTASKSAINEQPFIPITITPTDVLSGVNIDTAPPLLGFVITRSKPTSLFILATETGEPLLARWRYGLGISTAFTSDAKSRWAAEWLTWPEFPTFWAQIIRDSMRKSTSRGTSVEMRQQGGNLEVVFDAVDDADQYVNQATGTMSVIKPDLSKEEIRLEPTAPGRYETSLPLDEHMGGGGYQIQMSLKNGEKTLASQSRGVMVGYPDELRLKPVNEDLLHRIADSTGGIYNPKPDELFAPDLTRSAWKPTALWPYLLVAAAFLFLLDVLLRRIDLFYTRVR